MQVVTCVCVYTLAKCETVIIKHDVENMQYTHIYQPTCLLLAIGDEPDCGITSSCNHLLCAVMLVVISGDFRGNTPTSVVHCIMCNYYVCNVLHSKYEAKC